MEFLHFPMPICTYTLVMGCKLKTPISQLFLIRLRCDWAHFEGLEALFPTSVIITVLVTKGLTLIMCPCVMPALGDGKR